MRYVRAIARWYSIPLLLAFWQLAVTSGLVTSRLLPGLGEIWTAFVTDVGNGVLLYHAGITLARALIGFSLAAVVGIGLAAAMSSSVFFSRMFEPMFFLGYPVPKIALFPVFTFIFGIGSPSKIAFTFLECLYPIVVTTYLGIAGIQRRLVWVARNMGAGRPTVLRRVILPAALPSVFSGLRIALPVALVVVIVTEMIGDTRGLGYYVTIWSTRFHYANVYAGIVTIGLCGLILDQALIYARRWTMPWEPEEVRL